MRLSFAQTKGADEAPSKESNMGKNNIGSNLDEFLTEQSMLDEVNTIAVNRVSAWQFERELKACWAEIERGEIRLISTLEASADIRRKHQ